MTEVRCSQQAHVVEVHKMAAARPAAAPDSRLVGKDKKRDIQKRPAVGTVARTPAAVRVPVAAAHSQWAGLLPCVAARKMPELAEL